MTCSCQECGKPAAVTQHDYALCAPCYLHAIAMLRLNANGLVYDRITGTWEKPSESDQVMAQKVRDSLSGPLSRPKPQDSYVGMGQTPQMPSRACESVPGPSQPNTPAPGFGDSLHESERRRLNHAIGNSASV